MLYIKKVCLIKFSVADLILFGKFMRKQAAFDVNLIYKLFVLHTLKQFQKLKFYLLYLLSSLNIIRFNIFQLMQIQMDHLEKH